jgi:hypothetical protein
MHEQGFWGLSTFQLLGAQALDNEYLNNYIWIDYFNFAESKEKRSRGKQKREDSCGVTLLATGGTQARASTRWMPRHTQPMKDAETGETFKGSCMRAMSLEIPNGATHPE